MNKKTILKIILTIITIALITCLTTSVFAEDDEEAVDLSGSITSKEETTDDDKETTGDKETTTNKETTVDKNIPQTGLEDTMPIAILFVACGIIGVYTFIKLSQYSNI